MKEEKEKLDFLRACVSYEKERLEAEVAYKAALAALDSSRAKLSELLDCEKIDNFADGEYYLLEGFVVRFWLSESPHCVRFAVAKVKQIEEGPDDLQG